MDKAGKSAALETLKGVIGESGVVVVTHYTGLTVAEMTKLRGLLRKDGAHFKVVKNRLAKIALGGTGGDKAAELFQGPVAIAFAPLPIAFSVSFACKSPSKTVLPLHPCANTKPLMDSSTTGIRCITLALPVAERVLLWLKPLRFLLKDVLPQNALDCGMTSKPKV